MANDNVAGAGQVAPGAGVIHDIGYQTYEGPRLGRGQIALALCWHSLRSAFGFGRGAKAKIVPVITFVIMCAPAVINAVVMALSRSHARVIDYDTYTGNLRVLVLLVFMAAQAPELVSRDLRSRVLPLYFARPIRRQDYPLAKYAAFTLACLAMIDIPVLLLYIGTILQVHGGAAVWAQTRALVPGLLVGLMWAAVLSAIALVLACMSGRRAFSTGSVAIFFFMTWTLENVLTKIGATSGPPGPGGPVGAGAAASAEHVSAATHLFGLISPFTVLDGVRQWLGGTSQGIVAAPAGYGVAYGVILLLLLGISLAALVRRYGSVSVA
ncbi:MAG TPA: ABC-2 transporter permease [Streptosporangiaceae bacterium]|nr:ABC-2 transporter permease [Streptosporangiaceae bacterium]